MTTHYTEIADINIEGKWVNIEAFVQTLWDNEHPAIQQVGLLKDDTGIIKFISWTKSGLPLIREGTKYSFTNLVVSKYEDHYSVGLNKTTVITPIPHDDTDNAETSTI